MRPLKQTVMIILIAAFGAVISARVWDVDTELTALGKTTAKTSASAVETILSKARAGDAIRLSRETPLGKVVVNNAAPDIEISGGFDGEFHIEGNIPNWRFVYAGNNVDFYAGPDADLTGCTFFCSFSGGSFIDNSNSGAYTMIAPGLAPRLSKTGVDSRPGEHGIVWGFGNYKFENFGSKVVWMPAYYVDGAGARNETTTPQVEIRNGTDGGKWLFAIEAEQAAKCPAVKLYDSKRVQLYSGSTEGVNHQTGPVYGLYNCEEVVLGMRRFFSNHKGAGWSGTPKLGLQIDGGSGNILHNLIDISNPSHMSLHSTDPNLQIWQSFFEDLMLLQPNTFQFAVTGQGMINQVNTWTEPVLVENEVIIKKDQTNYLEEATPQLPPPPAFDFQPWMAKRLDKKRIHAGAETVQRRYRTSATFGAALLAAGADPTGTRHSDEAFSKLLSKEGIVEVPEGTFRLSRPLAVLRARVGGLAKTGVPAGSAVILGSGRGQSVLVADQSAEAVLDLRRPLGKSSGSADVVVVDGVSLSGGQNGAITDGNAPTIISDFAISGFAKAGLVVAGTGIVVPVEGGGCENDGNCADMHVYKNGTISGGDYGIYYTAFADKQGIRKVDFSDHAKAGIWARNTNLFHGWIGECTFTNIEGPGVDLSGGTDLTDKGYGYYVQWVTMIEGCEFTECGSADRAAVDYGFTDINMFCNSNITTTGKTIKYGFLGSLAEMSNVTINVNASKAGMALRNCRATEASRTPATILHSVTCNAPMLIADGSPAGDGGPSDNPVDEYVYTTRMSGDWEGKETHTGIKRWRAGVYDWSYMLLLYNSTIDGEEYDYVLKNSTGYTKNFITGETAVTTAAPAKRTVASQKELLIYDIRGRLIAIRKAADMNSGQLPQGTFFVGDRLGKHASKRLIVR